MDHRFFLLWFSFIYAVVSLDKRRMGRTIQYSVLPLSTAQEHWQISRATTVEILICTGDQINGSYMKWVKVFKNGPSKICGRQLLKIWSDMVCLSKSKLSPTNFTWSILEYLDPNATQSWNGLTTDLRNRRSLIHAPLKLKPVEKS